MKVRAMASAGRREELSENLVNVSSSYGLEVSCPE
jgi:hypothetical protein